jgi:NDP-sugar pyrophosphorylase family protein
MNRNPTMATHDQTRENLVGLMRRKGLRHLPLVDTSGKLTGIELLNEVPGLDKLDNLVVVMAGGLGRRLGGLTADTPKPMLSVKNRPLLETIVENLATAGFQDIYLSVNYKREVIQDHFRDGSHLNLNIQYLREDRPLGTVGSLSLLPMRPKKPLIVMNADLVTTVSFNSLLEFHRRRRAQATMCIRDYDFQVPYGVVRVNEKQQVLALEEKPKFRYFVNAGIYVLEPSCLDLIPKDMRMDMTDLMAMLLQNNAPIGAFPVREYWADIGRAEDLDKANRD